MKSKEYELFIKVVLESVSNRNKEAISDISHSKTIQGHTRNWEVDLSLYYSFLNFKHRMFIECKDWNTVVDINVISKIHDCVRDCGAHKGVVATTKGFTEPAVELAHKLGIGMLIVSDDKEPEFDNFTGKHLSFEDANNQDNWFSDAPHAKLLSGVISSNENFFEFLETRVSKFARQVVETKDLELIRQFNDQELILFSDNLTDAYEEFERKQTGGLPLEILNNSFDYEFLWEIKSYVVMQTLDS